MLAIKNGYEYYMLMKCLLQFGELAVCPSSLMSFIFWSRKNVQPNYHLSF